MIRRGLNKKNLEYWEKNVFNNYRQDSIPKLLAYKVCSEQEIEKLRDRIIKLEKKIKRL